MAILPNGPRSGSLRMPSYLRTLAATLAACGSLSATPYPAHAHPGQARAAAVGKAPLVTLPLIGGGYALAISSSVETMPAFFRM